MRKREMLAVIAALVCTVTSNACRSAKEYGPPLLVRDVTPPRPAGVSAAGASAPGTSGSAVGGAAGTAAQSGSAGTPVSTGSSGAAASGSGRGGASAAAGVSGAASAGTSGTTSAAGNGGAAGTPVTVPTTPQFTAEPKDAASYLFDDTAVRTYELTLTPEDLATIDANPSAEEYVPGTLTFEGKTYPNVGVRYKGSIGSFLTPCTAATAVGQRPGPKTDKCSIKVDIDHVDPEARFFGLKKLQFQAMGRDWSMMRERLGYGFYRAMGVASSRAMHVRLLINGQLEGVFLLTEQIDGRFTRARFPEGGEGNLYKEVWPSYDDTMRYLSALETNEDENPSVDKMLAFKRAVDAGPDQTAMWIDRDYTMRFVAVDRVIMADDGAFHWYCGGAAAMGTMPAVARASNHNYYWYEASNANRFWIIPWDLDNALMPTSKVHVEPEWFVMNGDCSCRASTIAGNSPQRAPSCDPLIASWASWRADYERHVDTFLAGPFSEAAVGAKLTAWTAQLQPFVAEAVGIHGGRTVDDFLYQVYELSEVLELARANRGYPYP